MDVPLAKARDQLGFLVDRVAHRGERMTLTRRGRRMAVVVSAEEMDRLDRIASSHAATFTPGGTPGRYPEAGMSVPYSDASPP